MVQIISPRPRLVTFAIEHLETLFLTKNNIFCYQRRHRLDSVKLQLQIVTVKPPSKNQFGWSRRRYCVVMKNLVSFCRKKTKAISVVYISQSILDRIMCNIGFRE